MQQNSKAGKAKRGASLEKLAAPSKQALKFIFKILEAWKLQLNFFYLNLMNSTF